MAAYGRGVARRVHEDERPDADQPVFVVTSARPGHSEEMSGRLRRYLISMSIRVVFLVLAIFVFTGWLRIVGIAAAVVLPWIAVVLANAGPEGAGDEATFVTPSRIALDAPAATMISNHPEATP
jgi:Protein of unknown function (DUF3099)